MTFFETEMRKFAEHCCVLYKPAFYDKMVMGKINQNVNVKIIFNNFGLADSYSGFVVEIINKQLGLIDKQTFRFGDIVGKRTVGGVVVNPYIWVCRDDVDWYGFKPDKQFYIEIMNIVSDYISFFV